jgi:nucleotide-binding universal stress UspA family protein
MATKPIVASTDGSEESLRAVEWAAREALLRKAPLRIVSVAELLPRMVSRSGVPHAETVADVARENRDDALATAAERAAKTAPDVLVDTDQLAGPIAEAVTESGSGALMLVVGSRGIGAFAAMILGSVSRYAATHASCPVIVVRDEPPAAHGQVGVGVGDLDDCAASLAFAFEEAALRNAGLIAVHAWHTPQSDISRTRETHAMPGSDAVGAAVTGQMESALADCRGKHPDVQVSTEVVHGHPGRALAGLSARTDLVVIGRRAPDSHGLRGPGKIRHALLNHAHGPVAVVPSA